MSILQLRHALATVLFCLCFSIPAAGQGPALFELSVADAPAENGKHLNVSFREIERTVAYSLVEVTFISGGSVSTSMFILKGMCGLARARGETAFLSEDEGKSPRRYRVSFPKNPSPEDISGTSKKVFTLSECARLKF